MRIFRCYKILGDIFHPIDLVFREFVVGVSAGNESERGNDQNGSEQDFHTCEFNFSSVWFRDD